MRNIFHFSILTSHFSILTFTLSWEAIMRTSGQTIIRKIILLFGVLILVIIVNAVSSAFHESRNESRNVSESLNNKLDIAAAVQNYETEKLRIISVSVKEQSGKFSDFLDYDNVVPITMMLKNITYLYPDDIDFIFLFDEDRELITSNIAGTESEEPDRYKTLIADTRERAGIEELSSDIFQGPLAQFKPVSDRKHILCFKSLLHILHDTGDIYCYVAVIKLINNNKKLIRKMAEMTGAEVIYYDTGGQPVLSTFPDLNMPYPPEITMSYQENSFFIRQKDILNYAGQPVGKLMVALDQKPFSDHRKQILLNRLLPFFTSVGISLLLFFLLKVRVFNKISQLIEVQRLVAEGKGDLSVRLNIPPEKTNTGHLDEVERMGMDFNLMMDKLEQTHRQLSLALTEVRAANNHIMGSLEYAKRIQNSMLPNPDEVRRLIPRSFVIWMPRDIVSGDIFFIEAVSEGFAAAVIDCTGHGVPGAFLTMIASSALRRIIRDEQCSDPALVLKRLNSIMKAALHQDTAYAVSDDGLDAALCMVNTEEKILTFSGAKLPLFYSEKGKMNLIKGDKQSIGYKQSKRSDIRFDFSNHTIRIREGMSFYIASDGFGDQLGPDKESYLGLKRLGSRRFAAMLGEIGNLSFEAQRDRLIEMFELHKGNTQRQDDVTVIGMGF